MSKSEDKRKAIQKRAKWIGVDFDGTLAVDLDWDGDVDKPGEGPPVPAMLARVKAWVAAGRDVRIFTARVAPTNDDGRNYALIRLRIENWCLEHVGVVLPITSIKDIHCEVIYDDRAVAVGRNTGELAFIDRETGEFVCMTSTGERR